jgi:formyl-CoA transferase/CoA:oxalate CoA-transferase
MSIQGQDPEGRPLHIGAAVSDMAAGVMAFMGIMLALFEREQSGLGQKVETANLMATLSMFCLHAQNYFMEGECSEGPMIVPHRAFPTKDGYMAISLPSNQYWPAFCKALGIEHLKDEPMFADNMKRITNREAFESLIEGILGQKTAEEWAGIFAEADAMGAPVHNYEEVFEDPQVLENDMLETVDHPVTGKTNMVGIPIKLSRTPGRIKSPPPTLGQHTEEILREIGYSKGKIEELRKEKII